jgi:hypothetical protein
VRRSWWWGGTATVETVHNERWCAVADKQASDANDDVKAKYREALEKKNKGSQGGTSHAEGGSAAHGEHAAQGTKRQFRRKSGG